MRIASLVLASLSLFWSSAALAALVTVTGGLPRTFNVSQFPLTITVDGLTVEEAAKGAPEPISSSLRIEFSSADRNPIAYDATAAALASVKLYAEINGPVSKTVANNLTTLVFRILIKGVDGNVIKALGETNKLDKVIATYVAGGLNIPSRETTLEKIAYVANELPQLDAGAAVTGTNRTLRVQWTPVTTIQTKGAGNGSETSRAPDGMTAVLIDPAVAQAGPLPAKEFQPDKAADPEGVCQLAIPNLSTDSEPQDVSACISCPANTYLDTDKLDEVPGLTVQAKVAVANGGADFGGLENDKPYAAFVYFEPGGLQISSCVPGVPRENLSITELNGEKSAKVVNFTCFVATAAYGSPLHEDLGVFRAFRDDVLLESPLGRVAVAAYYELSPPLAEFIAEREWLRVWVRGALEVVADWLRPVVSVEDLG